MSDENKIKIDLQRKETEAGWIKIQDNFGLRGAPIWFSWLEWIIVLSAFHYMFLKSGSKLVGLVIAISYSMLWLYFNAFFYKIEFEGIPFIFTDRKRLMLSMVISGLLAFATWRSAVSIAHELAAFQK